jgi:hypothetical protein
MRIGFLLLVGALQPGALSKSAMRIPSFNHPSEVLRHDIDDRGWCRASRLAQFSAPMADNVSGLAPPLANRIQIARSRKLPPTGADELIFHQAA